MKGFLIGNGESRRPFNLNALRGIGPIYGCNALYREFSPDVLVARDKGIIEEILSSSYQGRFARFYPLEQFVTLDDKKYHVPKLQIGKWGAGALALWLLCQLQLKSIYLLGVDCYQHTGKVNNVYKGTDNYLAADQVKIYSKDALVYREIFSSYKGVTFYRIGGEDLSLLPDHWLKVPNFRTLTYDGFDELLDTLRAANFS